MNEQKHSIITSCSYEQFHFRISRSESVVGICTPSTTTVTSGGYLYVNDTERWVMQRIFFCHRFYNTGQYPIDTVMIETGYLNMGKSTRQKKPSSCGQGKNFFSWRWFLL